jgi:putative phosphoesterase
MRIAALYDIHGNLPALEAVLDEVAHEGVDRIVVGGDVVPGPMPREALARLTGIGLPTAFIHGNGETDLLAELDGAESRVPEPFREAVRWSGTQLEDGQVRFMRTWPLTLRASVPEVGDVLFCHATPASDNEIFTRLTVEEDVARMIAGTDADVVVCGHTHMQFDRTIGGVRVVNAGSIGMPFGERGAFWLTIGPDVRLRRTEYDLAEAARSIRATAYPGVDAFVDQNLLHPPSEARMLEVFGGGDAR